MTTKHTPGPWRVIGGRIVGTPAPWQHPRATVPPVPATVVATVRNGDDGSYEHYPLATAEANARLLAAAPGMLAALQTIVEIADVHPKARPDVMRRTMASIRSLANFTVARAAKQEGNE
jgi:hypothetical protein